jgi:hypothetical protein
MTYDIVEVLNLLRLGQLVDSWMTCDYWEMLNLLCLGTSGAFCDTGFLSPSPPDLYSAPGLY